MRKRKLWKGLVAGSAAGLAGTVAMTQFQNLWSKASEKLKKSCAIALSQTPKVTTR